VARVRQHALDAALGAQAASRVRWVRTASVAAVAMLGGLGVGLAATQTGRDWIRSLFVPVEETHVAEWTSPDGGTWTRERHGVGPFSAEEKQALADTYAEVYRIKQAGGGRLVGLIENPSPFGGAMTTYLIEYTLSNGGALRIGSGRPQGKQAKNMRIDEIERLRDAGAGQIIRQEPSEMGMGNYLIRFTLSDGQTVDLHALYPPSTREERERMFAEMRDLRVQRHFEVLRAWRAVEEPKWGVFGILRYTLSDGRVVGTTELIPPDLVSDDGRFVVLPETGERTIISAGASPD